MYSVSSRGNVVLEEHSKELLYKIHCRQGAMAYDSKGAVRPLTECDIADVKLCAGLWRIQNKFDHKIQLVRGEEFVLLEKLKRIEKNMFEFYRAAIIGKNCYGRFLMNGAEKVIAKYETDGRTYWAYGNTIEQARAFLGIALYDEYQNLIDEVVCKKKNHAK